MLKSRTTGWAELYRSLLSESDPRFRHSVVVVPDGGSLQWIDSAFIIRAESLVFIFSREATFIYNSADLLLCREVVEVRSHQYDNIHNVPMEIG